MKKRLTVIIPIAQSLLWFALMAFGSMPVSEFVYQHYFAPAKSVITQVNFPVLFVWLPIFKGAEYVARFLPSSNGVLAISIAIAGGLLFVSSLALFWYLTVLEIEMRMQGRTLIRLTSRFARLLEFCLFLLFRLGAWMRAYGEASRLWYVYKLEGIFNAFFLTLWGLIFIGFGVHDALRSPNRKPALMRAPSTPD